MTKNNTIKRNIRFSVINARYKNNPVDIQKVFDFINTLDFNKGERYHETSEGINLAAFIDSK